ncbi:CDP-glucose 4,6-dehydratase [Variovorax sp. J22P271]|uniref:CDP-glucose 4,6-dehydratase n=1 Tax=Variovorax davisae TaxID=3053515 RepID=UPI00257629EE|nr:CDP-glucose 4,6-dehydratase [Variovorax sp. J22P271]MDM0033295.1 CDP-glucose 4,6-dehydratase [Variovorax sp. J22P271]
MEGLVVNPAFWRGRRVLVTGHTGFKGSWLALWLHSLGAEVHGYALSPPTPTNLFAVARIADTLHGHAIADVRDAPFLQQAVRRAAPEVVFHLAAQPLVRQSYREPVETYATNVMGTVNLLEAVRSCEGVRAVVNVTTDKCYDNREWLWGYREGEALGGSDPYASSKACAELVTAAYRSSFLAQAGVAVATARAGNVIGGGDWADDRLVPDFFRAVQQQQPLEVRYAGSTRPWQHVLEPLSGYLLLAERLALGGARFASAWNFGPAEDDAVPVRQLLDRLASRMPGALWRETDTSAFHEAEYLKLDSSKARSELGWRPRWSLDLALEKIVEWDRAWRAGEDMQQTCLSQIRTYEAGGGHAAL